MDVLPVGPQGSGTGRFTYDVAADRWEWDDTVYHIHGYQPHEVEPTTELFLRHKHDGDRARVESVFQQSVRTGEPFMLAYRLNARDAVRQVILVGEAVADNDQVQQIEGYYIDLTEEFSTESQAAADAAVAASAATRDTIEQAKGILMVSYGLNADAAFAMLRWWSRNRNVKVRTLAERLVDLAADGLATHPGLRSLIDTVIEDIATRRVQPEESSA